MDGVAKLFSEPQPMIQITPQMRILVCIEPIDFRKGVDGLCGVCRRQLEADPFCAPCSFSVTKQRPLCVFLPMTVRGFGCAIRGCRAGVYFNGRRTLESMHSSCSL